MLEIYKKLVSLRGFTAKDIVKEFRLSQKSAQNLLYRLNKAQLIMPVHNGLYVPVNLETNDALTSNYEIVRYLPGNSFISHHSAFEFYGFANQVFNKIYFSSQKRIAPFEFNSMEFKGLIRDTQWGVTVNANVRVSTLERTILDSINDFEKIGGFEELLHCLDMVTVVDEKSLLCGLKKFNTAFLYQKTGFLLSLLPSMKLSKKFFALCQSHCGNSTRYLYADLKLEKNVYNKTWQLCVPTNSLGYF